MKDERTNRGQSTQGGSHEQHVKAGEAGGKAPHTCRGSQCSSESNRSSHSSRSHAGQGSHGSETRGGSHEQHVKAGEAGGSAPHKCRGRQCSENE